MHIWLVESSMVIVLRKENSWADHTKPTSLYLLIHLFKSSCNLLNYAVGVDGLTLSSKPSDVIVLDGLKPYLL